MHVLRLLLRIFGEVGQPLHDLDELRPVFLLRVELHQLRQELAIVGALFEGGDVRLARARAVVELLELDVADLEEQIEPLGAARDLEALLLDADDLFELPLLFVDLRERLERRGVRRIEIGGLHERLDRFVEIARLARALAEAVEGVGALALRQRRGVTVEQLAVEGARRPRIAVIEHDASGAAERARIVGGELAKRFERPFDLRVRRADGRNGEATARRAAHVARGGRHRRACGVALRERLDEADEDANGVFLRHRRRPPDERLVAACRLRVALPFESDVAEDDERLDVRRIELDGGLRGRLGLVGVAEPLAVHLRELGVEAPLREIPLRVDELFFDERDDAERIAAVPVRVSKRRRRRRIFRVRVERHLVPLDGAVLVATRFEETSCTHPLLGLRFRRGGLRSQRFDRRERRVGIARHLAETRQRFECARMTRRQLEDVLVSAHRPLGRSDLLGQDARALDQEVDAPRFVARGVRVRVVELHEIFPPRERAVVTRERRERAVVRRVDGQDPFERRRRAAVVEELFVVDRRDPLEQVDLLPRRGRKLDLPLEVLDELSELPRPVEDPIEPLQGVDVRRLEGEHRFVAARGLDEVVEVIFVHLGHLEEDRCALGAASRIRALLELRDEGREVARPLGNARHRVARFGVPRIVGEDLRVHLFRARRIVQLQLEQLGGLGAEIAGTRRARSGVGAHEEDRRQLRPLLRAAVDGREPFIGRFARRVDLEDLLVRHQGEIGATELRVVPTPRLREQRRALFGRERVALRPLRDRGERLVPERPLVGRQSLDFGDVLRARRRLAERARVREERLLGVVELVREDASDLGERAGAVCAGGRRFAPRDEHLDDLVVLAERLANFLEGALRDVVVRIELDDLDVDLLGALFVFDGRVEDAGRAVEEPLLRLAPPRCRC